MCELLAADTEKCCVPPYMVQAMTEQEREAIDNAIPRKPTAHELGGGIYYTCHWLKCGNTVHRYDRYCSACGQRILWDKDDMQREIYILKDGKELRIRQC